MGKAKERLNFGCRQCTIRQKTFDCTWPRFGDNADCTCTFLLSLRSIILLCIGFSFSCLSILGFFITGAVFIDDCPDEPVIPVWCMVASLVPFFLTVVYLFIKDNDGHPVLRKVGFTLLLLSVVWTITGVIWIAILLGRSDPSCDGKLQNFAIVVLSITGVMCVLAIILQFCNKLNMKLGPDYRRKLFVMIMLGVAVCLSQLITGLVFTIRNDCPAEPFIGPWSVVASFFPVVAALCCFGVVATHVALRVVSISATVVCFAFTLAGTVFAVRINNDDNISCSKAVKEFVIFQQVLCWMCCLGVFILFIYHTAKINLIKKNKVVPASRDPNNKLRDLYAPTYWDCYNKDKTLLMLMLAFKGKHKLRDVDPRTEKAVNDVVQDTWRADKVGVGRDAKGLTYTRMRVLKVQRLENVELYNKYAQRRQNIVIKAKTEGDFAKLENITGSQGPILTTRTLKPLFSSDLDSSANETFLFHGTKADLLSAVMNQGLDSRLSSVGAMFGQGIYLAESSTKSDQYTDPKNQRNQDEKIMLLVRACLGEMCMLNTAQKLKRPPCADPGCGKDVCDHKARHDSVVADGNWIFREFILYDRDQCYPEFVITYIRE